jgi:hypothetical protein
MYMKYQKYLQRKRLEVQNLESLNDNNNSDDSDDDFLDEINKHVNNKRSRGRNDVQFDASDFNDLPNLGPLNELDDPDGLYETREIKEYSRDKVNNNLMNRMNSDIYIKTLKNKKSKPRTIIPPYGDGNCQNYAPYKNNDRTNNGRAKRGRTI